MGGAFIGGIAVVSGDDGVVYAGSILIPPEGAGAEFDGQLFSFGERQHNQQNPN